MKVVKTTAVAQKMVGVLGATGEGFYIRNLHGGSLYVLHDSVHREDKTLEELLDENSLSRKPIYEGETLTITF